MIEIDIQNSWDILANKIPLANPKYDDYIFNSEIRNLLYGMGQNVSTNLIGYKMNPRGFESYNIVSGRIIPKGPLTEFKSGNPEHLQFRDFDRMVKLQIHFDSEDDEALFKLSW